jgi:CHASE2 domain-containing sensor protein
MPRRGPTVFISYRREDASANAGRLFDWLRRQFGAERVFLDTDTIAPGDDFPRVLEERLALTDVLLAVIGPRWLAAANERGRRLDQPDDYVRREIAAALARGTWLIPVLVGGARFPPSEELPEPLRPLTTRNAASIDDAKFERDFELLVDVILKRPRGYARRQLDRLQRMLFVAKAAALVVPVLAIGLALAVWMQALDFLSLDTKAASYLLWAADRIGGAGPEPPVLIAAIDDATEKALGRSLGPTAEWRRDHARVIDRAAAAGARAVVFDLFFEQGTEADADGELAAAARRARAAASPTRVVFGVRDARVGRPNLLPQLQDAGAWGSLCISRRVGYTFSAPLAVMRVADPALGGRRLAGDLVPADTPALALPAVYAGSLEEADISRRQLRLAGREGAQRLHYSTVERIRASGNCATFAAGDEVAMLLLRLSRPGAWRDPARRVSYAELLDAMAVPAERLKGRIVLVGAMLAGKDVHRVVDGFSYAEVWGVELQADAIANLATGRVVETPTVGRQTAIMLFMAGAGACASFLTATLARGRRSMILAAVVAVYGLIAVAAAVQGFLLNVLYDLAAFVAAHALIGRLQSRLLGPFPGGEPA